MSMLKRSDDLVSRKEMSDREFDCPFSDNANERPDERDRIQDSVKAEGRSFSRRR
jgi:hypothetical protein